MWWSRNKITVAVHDGDFHADDIFAVAILALFLRKPLKIFRTRDEEKYKKMNYLLDVGREYNPVQNKFDHHQEEGAGQRENGIPYASGGLVWKEFGEKICESKEIAEIIDRMIIQDIDAADNGIDVYREIAQGVESYLFEDYLYAFNATWTESEETQAENFRKAVELTKNMLNREIKHARDFLMGKKIIEEIYKKTKDKRIIILDENYPWRRVLSDFPEPMFVVRPIKNSTVWHVSAVKVKNDRFKNRLDFPASWSGKSGEELTKITGVPDALFCHRNLFMCSAQSKEGAIKLAELVLNNK